MEAFHKVVEIKEGKTNHLEMWVGHTLVMIIDLWVYICEVVVAQILRNVIGLGSINWLTTYGCN